MRSVRFWERGSKGVRDIARAYLLFALMYEEFFNGVYTDRHNVCVRVCMSVSPVAFIHMCFTHFFGKIIKHEFSLHPDLNIGGEKAAHSIILPTIRNELTRQFVYLAQATTRKLFPDKTAQKSRLTLG